MSNTFETNDMSLAAFLVLAKLLERLGQKGLLNNSDVNAILQGAIGLAAPAQQPALRTMLKTLFGTAEI